MSIPSSIVIKKDGVEYLNNVDRIKYTLDELTRVALKDVGKFICKRTRVKIKRKTGRVARNIQYWVRKKSGDLQVGFKPVGFYGGFQELGTSKQPKIGALSQTVLENIDEIRKIEGQYLKAIEDENKALGLINEDEEIGNADD